MNRNLTHQLAFHIGEAKFASELKLSDIAALFEKFGFTPAAAERFRTGKLAELLLRLDDAIDDETKGMKDFADLIGTEIRALADILKLEIEFCERDYYAAAAGGWASS
jgi:hypothetical protein